MKIKTVTVITSIAILILSGTIILVHSLNTAAGSADVVNLNSDPFQFAGSTRKIVVEVQSPYGSEIINSFRTLQTDNLMAKQKVHMFHFIGSIPRDKFITLQWIADALNREPLGVVGDGSSSGVCVKPGCVTHLTKPTGSTSVENTNVSTGKLTVYFLEGLTDITETDHDRMLKLSGCYVADYNLGTKSDKERPIGINGNAHIEQITFACSNIDDIGGSGDNGIMYERAQLHPQIMNEKGELIIKSKEKYSGQSTIAIEDQSQSKLETKSKQVLPKEIVTRIALDKPSYKIGDRATFIVTFTDLEGNNIDPSKITVVYDGTAAKLQKGYVEAVGIYTFTTPSLDKNDHALIVSAEKEGYGTDTIYRTVSAKP